MQIKLTVNGGNAINGAIGDKGILGANVMILVPAEGENRVSIGARIHAYESSGTSEWRVENLSIGDKIEIELLPGVDSDPPTETRQSHSGPMLLFSDIDQARNALLAAHICNEQLQGVLRAAGQAEPHAEAIKIQRAIAWLVQNLGGHLIRPIVNRHPDLLSEAKDLGLLD
jgi:hypothetical protein